MTTFLQLGYSRVVIMDSDSQTLPVTCLTGAFADPHEADVVLGPCSDGGYYLISGSSGCEGRLTNI